MRIMQSKELVILDLEKTYPWWEIQQEVRIKKAAVIELKIQPVLSTSLP